MITAAESKVMLRISHDALNKEIEGNIAACLLDVARTGVDKSKDTQLLDKACELYCKWQFDFEGKGDRYQKNYEQLRDSMSLAGDYRCTTNKSV